ncbi:RimK/LysX family protein [Candidatus Woesearchaeota archaeon]|nr:RimK/LysX family protein [Candidatus Woesearchaeota archaeon]
MTSAKDTDDEQHIIGFTEPVLCTSNGKHIQVRARIDTGASKSSIDEKLAKELGLGPILGEKTIRNAHGSSSRKFVDVTIELAGRKFTEHFTIADRSTMRFPVLIGRNILRKGFLINPKRKARKVQLK